MLKGRKKICYRWFVSSTSTLEAIILPPLRGKCDTSRRDSRLRAYRDADKRDHGPTTSHFSPITSHFSAEKLAGQTFNQLR